MEKRKGRRKAAAERLAWAGGWRAFRVTSPLGQCAPGCQVLTGSPAALFHCSTLGFPCTRDGRGG